MTADQNANRTTGETEGIDQEPTDVAETDTTQQKQAANRFDPSEPDPTSVERPAGQALDQGDEDEANIPPDPDADPNASPEAR